MGATVRPRPGDGIWRPGASNPSDLTRLEVASGVVEGPGVDLPLPREEASPRSVLARLARPLLAATPCVIAFSGGRDSSALLAAFTRVARQEGLPLPVPVTARWDDQASDESEWQEVVVRALGLDEWAVIRPETDLDLLGDEARRALRAHGLQWPPPAYAFAPMMQMATGGTFVSGEGGDEAFGLWPYARAWSYLRRGGMPRSSDLRLLAVGLGPRPLRRARWRRTASPYQTWLRPEALTEVGVRMAEDLSDNPVWWHRYQRVSRNRRAVVLTVQTLGRLAERHGTRFVAPLLDRDFLGALARWGGWLGRGDRTAVMIALFGDELPAAVLGRTSKASFGGVFWGPESRRFARTWDGWGLPDDLLDPEALRQAWLAPVPVYGAALPLHAAWLATTAGERLAHV